MPAISVSTERRITAIGVMILALIGVIGLRLLYIQVIKHKTYAAQATNSQSRKFAIPAQRGQIYAYDGDQTVPLVLNETFKVVYADPSLIKNKNKVAKEVAAAIGGSVADYEKKLKTKGSYVILAQKVPASAGDKLKKRDLLGVGISDQVYRTYPEGDLAAQILGFVNSDGAGQYGVEGFMDKELGGVDGLRQVKTDTKGNPIAIAGSVDRPATDGKSYVLTIDRNIQAQAEYSLAEGVKNVGAKSGSVIIMDPNNGAIKAMANYPTFDPGDYAKIKDYSVFSNSAIASQFEPGSGFKMFTMSAGLDSGKVKPDTTYTDTGEVELDGYTIKNSSDKKWGVQNMADVIEKSLNTGVIFVLRSLGGNPEDITLAGKKLFYSYVQKYGFGKPTGIQQSGEAAGAVNQPSRVSGNDVNYANMTFGQGISTTMIQMITAASAIANGGKLYQPQLVAGVKEGEVVKPFTPKVVNPQVISKQAAANTVTMMESVVQGKYGSGYKARMPGYTVAGKTGTAQIPNANGRGYREDKNIGTFIGFAPSKSPKFIMMVRINEPNVSGFAESTTVPVFADIAKWLVTYMQIPPSQ
jgi:cell division protein FtsI/penicillin-binding protein 2